MNLRRVFCFLFTALLISATDIVCAQIFPVQANIQIQPPYSPYLTDYTSPGTHKLILQLRANDITISDHPIKLRITIEGLGITIRTKQNFIPQPLTFIGGGAPTILYGEDLHEYFNPNNLDFAGLSKKEFSQTGKLPEGVYRFSVEVLSYKRNVQLSNKAMTMAWIILNDPPLLNLPRKDTKVTILDPTNIAFTWTPRHTGSPNSAFTTEYNFKLVEIWPADRNPNDAFLSQPALYEITTTQSQIIYGLAEPALIPGRKYAWQVQAVDTEGRDLFKNQGRSEVYAFQFGDAIGTPENLRKEGGNASTLSLRWELPLTGDIPDQYRVRYKPDFNDNWYESVTSNRWITLGDLRENTTYDVQVRAEKGKISGEYTALQKHSTNVKKEDAFSCGEPANIQPPENTGILLSLSPGDIFTCSDFKVTVTEITSATNGMFIGKGIMPVNMFNGAHVKVTFSGTINSNHQLITGSVKTVYEKGSEMAQVIDEMHKIGEKKQPQPDSAQQNPADAAITHIVDGIIDSVFVNEEGQIVVIDEEGNETTYEPNKDEKGEVQPTIIADAGGNTYMVDKDGKVTKNSVSQDTTASSGNANSNVISDPIKDRIIVLILEQFEEEIAAWLRDNGKGALEDDIIKLIIGLQKNFPEDVEVLEYIHEELIPYFKQHQSELTEEIESHQSNKQLLDKVSKLFSDPDGVDWGKITEEDQEALRSAAAEELIQDWWDRLPYWKRAAKILEEHLEDTDVYENITRTCDDATCVITADLKLGEDITYTMEVTITSSMSADALISMLKYEYRVDQWDAFNVKAEDMWDELYHWWRKQNDNLAQQKGWQVSALNFLADVFTAPTLVPAVQGWITGKHWRDGHELKGWEQALAALDFLVAEEMVKGCITNFVVKVGSKTVNLLRLKEGTKYLVQKSIEKGLKFSVLANDE